MKWHKFSEEKPPMAGEYLTINENGGIANLMWSETYQAFNVQDDISTAIEAKYWAYLDDVYPDDEELRDTYVYDERGKEK